MACFAALSSRSLWFMAMKTYTVLVSDLSGEEIEGDGGRTVTFGLDGQAFEIELTNDEIDKLRSVLDPYIEAGRKVGGTQRRRSRAGASANGGQSYDAKAVRKWAEANGIEVSARGRIPASILEQYQAAGN